jgi:hypothetical protein
MVLSDRIGVWNLDPIPEDVRAYLREHFQNVHEESPEGDYYVFGVMVSGSYRNLKVHRNFFMFADLVPRYLRDNDIAGQLQRGGVEIAEPFK